MIEILNLIKLTGKPKTADLISNKGDASVYNYNDNSFNDCFLSGNSLSSDPARRRV